MAISETSAETNLNPSTSLPAASHVNPSAKRDDVPDSSKRMVRRLAAVFGLNSPALFANLDPDTFWPKTCQGCLLSTDPWPKWSETWPDAAMWDSTSAYELAISEQPIYESGFSSSQSTVWKTPRKSPASMYAEAQETFDQRGKDTRETLARQALHANWPTANTRDAASAARHTTTTGVMHPGTTLTDAIRNWPTPQEDGESCGNHPDKMDSLTGVTRMWPTPNVPNGGRTSNVTQVRENGTKRQLDLGAIAGRWATPGEDNANNAAGPSRSRGTRAGAYRDLTVDVANWKTPHGMSNKDHKGKVGGCGGGEFAKQANQWRTPNTRDHHAGGPRLEAEQRQISLCDQAPLWQTPATDSFRSRGGDRSDEMGLDQQARLWGTPRMTHGPTLPAFLEHSPQAQAIRDGLTSSDCDQTSLPHWQTPSVAMARGEQETEIAITDGMGQRGKFGNLIEQVSAETQGMGPRRLNPRFVEFLMGLPIGWTELPMK